MTDRPIIFSAPMVRAIRDGRKMVTRRLVTSRHPITCIGSSDERDDPSAWGYFFDGPDHHGYMVLGRGHDDCHDHGKVSIPCPYGSPGDRLWVRETWGVASEHVDADDAAILRDAKAQMPWAAVLYGADRAWTNTQPRRWRPSIHMPRWASRLTLEVVSVRVERVQEITEDDARAEGVNPADAHIVIKDGDRQPDMERTHRGSFACLWDSLNADRAPWGSNPWVWRVEFKVVQP